MELWIPDLCLIELGMDSSQTITNVSSGGNGVVTNQLNDGGVVDDSKQNLNQVINSIQKTLGLLHQLYLTVSSFNAASQLPLLQRLYIDLKLDPFCFVLVIEVMVISFWFGICRNSLVMELDNMVKLSEKSNVEVPVEVLK